MATVDVVTVENKKAGTVDLDPVVFEAQVRPHLFHAEVRRQLAGRHRGTHSTKNRTAVSGGGAKPWRQKGTGRARQGTTRAPQWKGGGAVFGPVPRDYAHKLPKKMRRAAMRGALSQRLGEGSVTVVEGLAIEEYKTKLVREMLAGLGLAEHSVLLIVESAQPHLERSARNLPGVKVLQAAGLNVYDVLGHDKLVITKGAVPLVAERLGAEAQS